jgi:hypothetical protein
MIIVVGIIIAITAEVYAGIVHQYPGGFVTFKANTCCNAPGSVTTNIAQGSRAIPAREEYYLDYWLKYRPGWIEGQGGKIPGLVGGTAPTGCVANVPDGWSARFMWDPLRLYLYHQDRTDGCGDSYSLGSPSAFTVDVWHRITQRVKINTPDVANGIIQVWINGTLRYSNSTFRLRGAVSPTTALVDKFNSTIFRGGSDSSWSVPSDTTIDFKNFYFLDCQPVFTSPNPNNPPACSGGITPDPTTGLIARYSFEEGAGSTATSTINAPTVNAALTGSFSYQPGVIGSFGLQMNGTGVGTIPGLMTAPSSLTITGHVLMSGSTTNGHTVANIGDYVGLRIYDSGRLRGFYWNGTSIIGLDYFGSIPAGWNHVVYTHTNGRNELYLNGIRVATSTATPIVWTGRGSNTTIGNHATGSTGFDLKGRLDEVRMYNRVLSPDDITALLSEAPSAPTVSIISPTTTTPFNTNSNSIIVSGSASDNVAVASITGTCPTCTPSTLSITCTNCGTQNVTWSTTTTTLAEGNNTFTITATDNQGTTSSDFITINYTVGATADFYVSKSGNDNNNGTSSSTAWLTIQKAANSATAGSTVLVGPGVYNERVTVNVSGTSTAPITFKGTKSGSEYLTIIDGSDAAVGWVTAPEVGSGVYKNTAIGYQPFSLTSNQKMVQKISNRAMNGEILFGVNETGFQVLAKSNSATINNGSGTVEFWDGVEALYGYRSNVVYLRFRAGENPNTMSVRTAPSGGTVNVISRNYITIKDFLVRGGGNQIRLSGGTGHRIEGNDLRHGQPRISLESGVNNSVIHNNNFFQDGIHTTVFQMGEWNTFNTDRITKRNFYNIDKFYVNETTENGSSIEFNGNPQNITITNNTFDTGAVGLRMWQGNNIFIRDNHFKRFAAEGIWLLDSVTNTQISGNLFEDAEHHIRIQLCQQSKSLWIYANKFYQPKTADAAKHIHYSATATNCVDSSPIWVYHNSFSGDGWANDVGGTGEGVKDFTQLRILNNIISVQGQSSGGFDAVGEITGNQSNSIWRNNTTPPTFELPTGHSLRNTATSLIPRGLPGITTEYYEDGLPDYGAIQGDLDISPEPEPDVPIPSRLVFLTQPNNTATCPAIGATLQIGLLDQFNNPIAVDNIPVTLSIETNPGVGVLQGDLVETIFSGVAFIRDWCITEAGIGYTVIISSPGLVSGTSNAFDITSETEAAKVSIIQYPTGMNTNVVTGVPIVVHILDANDMLVETSTAEVTLSLSDPGTAVISGTLVKNAVNGVVTYIDIKVNKRGDSYRFLAEATGLADGLSGIVVVNRDFASGQQAVSYRSTVVSGIRTRR